MRQSSSRIHRNRGWKVKHVLQICLLLAVCVWLLYQVKHSHERKRSSEQGISRASERIEDARAEPIKLGRKDPLLKTVSVPTDGAARSDDEENEEAEEAAEQQEDKQDESEEEEMANGEDDVDDVEREGSDAEAEDGEEGAEEGEEKEAQPEDPNSPENDHEEADGSSQIAREENYKADDVSSAVARVSQEEAQENADHSELSIVEGPQSEEKDGLDLSDNNASRKDTAAEERGFELGPPPNSTLVPVSAGSAMDHNDTGTGFSDLLEDHGSNSTRSEPSHHILPGNSTTSEPDIQIEFSNSTISQPGNQTELGNSTTSEPSSQIELGNSTMSEAGEQIELGNSSMYQRANQIDLGYSMLPEPGTQIELGNSSVSELRDQNELNGSIISLPSDRIDPGNQIEQGNILMANVSEEKTGTPGGSTGNDTQSTDFPRETPGSANETGTLTAEKSSSENVSAPAVDQNETARGNNESDIIPPQKKDSNVTEGAAAEDHEALTDLPRVPEIHLGTKNPEEEDAAAE